MKDSLTINYAIEKYFAYGSNLYLNHFKSRCPSATFFNNAILKDYKLTFPLNDKEWEGGVAGVFPSKNSRVEGVIYEISHRDLKKLDEYEFVEKGDYDRKRIIVETFLGELFEVWIYIPKEMKDIIYRPTEKYKQTLISGAILHGLSQEYINSLKNI